MLSLRDDVKVTTGSQTHDGVAIGARSYAVTDVDVPGAELERSRYRLPLVLEGRARQIEVHLVRADLLLLGRKKSDPEPDVIAR